MLLLQLRWFCCIWRNISKLPKRASKLRKIIIFQLLKLIFIFLINIQLFSQLDLELSSETVKPGANVTLSIGSYVNSTVSLSCIDQSVILLQGGRGNDFTVDDVISSLDNYNYLNNNYWWQYSQEEQPFGVSLIRKPTL